MNNIEKVKKILTQYGNFMDGCDADGDVLDIDEATQEICQLLHDKSFICPNCGHNNSRVIK